MAELALASEPKDVADLRGSARAEAPAQIDAGIAPAAPTVGLAPGQWDYYRQDRDEEMTPLDRDVAPSRLASKDDALRTQFEGSKTAVFRLRYEPSGDGWDVKDNFVIVRQPWMRGFKVNGTRLAVDVGFALTPAQTSALASVKMHWQPSDEDGSKTSSYDHGVAAKAIGEQAVAAGEQAGYFAGFTEFKGEAPGLRGTGVDGTDVGCCGTGAADRGVLVNEKPKKKGKKRRFTMAALAEMDPDGGSFGETPVPTERESSNDSTDFQGLGYPYVQPSAFDSGSAEEHHMDNFSPDISGTLGEMTAAMQRVSLTEAAARAVAPAVGNGVEPVRDFGDADSPTFMTQPEPAPSVPAAEPATTVTIEPAKAKKKKKKKKKAKKSAAVDALASVASFGIATALMSSKAAKKAAKAAKKKAARASNKLRRTALKLNEARKNARALQEQVTKLTGAAQVQAAKAADDAAKAASALAAQHEVASSKATAAAVASTKADSEAKAKEAALQAAKNADAKAGQSKTGMLLAGGASVIALGALVAVLARSGKK